MNREIVAKTITGRGRLDYLYEENISLDNDISKTLGCWIINLQYEVVEEREDIYLKGSYSIQLWYAKNNDQASSVFEKKIEFKEKMTMVYRSVPTLDNSRHIKVFVNRYPSSTYMHLNNDKSITLRIEALYFIDVFQEAILVIETKENAKADMTMDEELLLSVNPNYLVGKDNKL